jgi:hypothetical protein
MILQEEADKFDTEKRRTKSWEWLAKKGAIMKSNDSD